MNELNGINVKLAVVNVTLAMGAYEGPYAVKLMGGVLLMFVLILGFQVIDHLTGRQDDES